MLRKILLYTIISFSLTSAAFSQQAKCDSILKQPMGSAMSNNDEITANLAILLECEGYDASTKKYFSKGHNVFDVMSYDIMRFIGDVKYSVLTHFIDSLINETTFKDEMWYSIEMERINKEPASLEVFESNEKFFRRAEPDPIIFEEIRIFYKNLGPTGMDMQASFRAFYTEKIKAEVAKKEERKKVDWYYLSLKDIESATAKVAYTDLLVAIYFNSKDDEKSRQMEEDVLSDSEVNMTLSIQFITLKASCNDPAALSAADQKKFAEYFGEPVKTVGQKNTLYREKFASSHEVPLFVILNESGEVVKIIEYTLSHEEFHKSLKSCTQY